MRVQHRVTGATGTAGPVRASGPFDGDLAPLGWRHTEFDDGLTCLVPDHLLEEVAA